MRELSKTEIEVVVGGAIPIVDYVTAIPIVDYVTAIPIVDYIEIA